MASQASKVRSQKCWVPSKMWWRVWLLLPDTVYTHVIYLLLLFCPLYRLFLCDPRDGFLVLCVPSRVVRRRTIQFNEIEWVGVGNDPRHGNSRDRFLAIWNWNTVKKRSSIFIVVWSYLVIINIIHPYSFEKNHRLRPGLPETILGFVSFDAQSDIIIVTRVNEMWFKKCSWPSCQHLLLFSFPHRYGWTCQIHRLWILVGFTSTMVYFGSEQIYIYPRCMYFVSNNR